MLPGLRVSPPGRQVSSLLQMIDQFEAVEELAKSAIEIVLNLGQADTTKLTMNLWGCIFSNVGPVLETAEHFCKSYV